MKDSIERCLKSTKKRLRTEKKARHNDNARGLKIITEELTELLKQL